MKKKLCALFLSVLMAIPLSGCVGEFLLVMIVADAVATYGDPYVMRINWGIQLPDGYEELYGTSEKGRDGNRYHVVRYGDESVLDDLLSWGEAPYGANFKSFSETVLDAMEVPLEFRPDYEASGWYYTSQTDDNRDKLLLLRDGNTLYIVECYM